MYDTYAPLEFVAEKHGYTAYAGANNEGVIVELPNAKGSYGPDSGKRSYTMFVIMPGDVPEE